MSQFNTMQAAGPSTPVRLNPTAYVYDTISGRVITVATTELQAFLAANTDYARVEPPGAVDDLAAVINESDVDLTWTDPSGSVITLELQRSDDAGETWDVLDDEIAAEDEAYTDEAPAAGNYLYRIRVNAPAVGEWSNVEAIEVGA